jgi:two-component system, OmpR family, phosphate regulon response regulator PhoB
VAKIFVIEDDASIAQSILKSLAENSFETLHAQNISEAHVTRVDSVDAFVLDLGLPDGSGFSLVPWIRERSAAPILFITALNSAENRLKALELGAHDFIPKPFLFRELLLRLQRSLQKVTPSNQIAFASGYLDLDKMCFEAKSGEISFIPSKDFRVLKLLIDSSPKPVSRDQVLDHIWGHDKFPSQRTIDNTIVRLRQILGDEAGEVIRSVRGLGYQWTKNSDSDKGESQ